MANESSPKTLYPSLPTMPHTNAASNNAAELPQKIEPKPQSPQQSLKSYLEYYDQVCRDNGWDDIMAALYLPRYLSDKRVLQFIEQELLPEQRTSYRWLRQILIDLDKYQGINHSSVDNGNNNSGQYLYEKYWEKFSSLNLHLRNDLTLFQNNFHQLFNDTYEHVQNQFIKPGDQLLNRNILPTLKQMIASTVPVKSDRWQPPPPPPAMPSATLNQSGTSAREAPAAPPPPYSEN